MWFLQGGMIPRRPCGEAFWSAGWLLSILILYLCGRLNGDIVQRIVVPVFGDDFMKGMFTGATVTMRAVHG
jgi:hypothetical protein